MSQRGLEGLSATLHSISSTAKRISDEIEVNPAYLPSDVKNNPDRVCEAINQTLLELGIVGFDAEQIREEALRNLRHMDGIPYQAEWIANSDNIEM